MHESLGRSASSAWRRRPAVRGRIRAKGSPSSDASLVSSFLFAALIEGSESGSDLGDFSKRCVIFSIVQGGVDLGARFRVPNRGPVLGRSGFTLSLSLRIRGLLRGRVRGSRRGRPRRLWGHTGGVQARACFRWSNFVQASSGGSKPVLLLNLDETSVKL